MDWQPNVDGSDEAGAQFRGAVAAFSKPGRRLRKFRSVDLPACPRLPQH